MNTKTLSTNLLSGLIMVSILFLSACSPFGGVPVVMAQPNYFEETSSRTWEIDVDDIAAAREAAETLSQNYAAIGVDFEEMDLTRSWEIGLEDIAAAREAAEILSNR